MAEDADERAQPLALGGEVAAEHRAPTTGERDEPGAQPQQRRLAGAVRAAQPHDLAAIDGQRDAGDGGKATEHGDGTVEVDHHQRSGAAPPDPIPARSSLALARSDALASLAHCRATLAPYPVASMGRTSRWDRPPRPRDLRWFVRLFGKTLIVIGLLMFGFVAYQLWGTGIEYSRAQDRAENQFEELLAHGGSDRRSADADVDDDDRAADDDRAPDDDRRRRRRPTTASTTTSTHHVDDRRSDDDRDGAVVDIAALGIEDGDSLRQAGDPADRPRRLSSSPASAARSSRRVLGTTRRRRCRDSWATAAIAGHRTTYGGPFLEIDELEPGDEIIVDDPVRSLRLPHDDDRDRRRRRLAGDRHHRPDDRHADVDVVPSGRDGVGADHRPRRARLDAVRRPNGRRCSTTAATPSPTRPASCPERTPPTRRRRAASTTSTSTSTTSTPLDDQHAGVDDRSDVDDVDDLDDAGARRRCRPTRCTRCCPEAARSAVATTAATARRPRTPSATTGSPTRRRGRRSPCGALWPTAVVVGGYFVAKRFRNSWIGLAAGVVPFVVALYFFYQNVNRLLPAAL